MLKEKDVLSIQLEPLAHVHTYKVDVQLQASEFVNAMARALGNAGPPPASQPLPAAPEAAAEAEATKPGHWEPIASGRRRKSKGAASMRTPQAMASAEREAVDPRTTDLDTPTVRAIAAYCESQQDLALERRPAMGRCAGRPESQSMLVRLTPQEFSVVFGTRLGEVSCFRFACVTSRSGCP